MNTEVNPRRATGPAVPPRALAISGAALLVSLAAAVLFPQGMLDYGFLVWLLPMIPAFLLCHYRGWNRLMVMLGAGMALLSMGHAVAEPLGVELPEWSFFGFVMAAYIGIALGAGWFSEVREAVQERRAAEMELRKAYLDLRKSHTDLQLAQWKLIESEKLEAVGQLAAGVAHEVKNPLMTLLTGVAYLRQQVPHGDGALKTLLDDMQEAVKRADAVITGLLDFSAPRELTLAPADLNSVIERSAGLVKLEVTKARVALRLELEATLPVLALDTFKLQQVLINLFTNAAHATPPGGTITARTYRGRRRVVNQAPGRGGPQELNPGDEVIILEVDDTGTGIPEHALSKLFSPFYTTKPAGKGTGLGLAVTRQIVEMHRGSIHVGNRPQGGARVTITFDLPREGSHHGEKAHSAGR